MRALSVLLAIIFLLSLVHLVSAASQASQPVTIQINPINELATSPGPGSLIVDTAVAGQELSLVSDSSASYSFSTNQDTRKIICQLNLDMPSGTTLEAEIASPGGSWSVSGKQTLSTTTVTLAQGGRGRAQNKTITYTFTATTSAGVIALSSRTATFTITSQ